MNWNKLSKANAQSNCKRLTKIANKMTKIISDWAYIKKDIKSGLSWTIISSSSSLLLVAASSNQDKKRIKRVKKLILNFKISVSLY